MQPFSDDGATPLLHGSRQLSEVTMSVSTVAGLTAALINGTVDKIVVAQGTYEFGSYMAGCAYPTALCINRNVTIEAEVEGGVVLDGMDARRVITVDSGGTADLVGLNITRGYVSEVSSHS